MGCSQGTQDALINAGVAVVGELLDAAAQLLVLANPEALALPALPKPMLGDDMEAKMQKLVNDLQEATEKEFLTKYTYVYNGPRSVPSDLYPGGRVTAAEDFVMVGEGDRTALTNYVDNTILGAGSGLPAWFTQLFTSDLLATMTTIIGQGLTNFQYEVFQKQYSDTAGTGMKPISVNAIMTFASATFTAPDGSTASKSVIYYAGVYYNSQGWSLVPRMPNGFGASAGREIRVTGGFGADPPPPGQGYPIIRIAIATGTIILSSALAAYILRLPLPAPPTPAQPIFGICFTAAATQLSIGIFKFWGNGPKLVLSSSDPDFEKKRRAMLLTGGSTLGGSGIDSTWIEKELVKLGYKFSVEETVSDPQWTAEIVLQNGFSQRDQTS